MLKDNLSALRTLSGASQEEIAQVVGVSRQAYAKWENGTTVPDIEKCAILAEHYGVTLDSMVGFTREEGNPQRMPAPKGKHIWGAVTVGERVQVVIPKAARDLFGIKGGDRLVVLGDEAEGIALVRAEVFEQRMNDSMRAAGLL